MVVVDTALLATRGLSPSVRAQFFVQRQHIFRVPLLHGCGLFAAPLQCKCISISSDLHPPLIGAGGWSRKGHYRGLSVPGPEKKVWLYHLSQRLLWPS